MKVVLLKTQLASIITVAQNRTSHLEEPIEGVLPEVVQQGEKRMGIHPEKYTKEYFTGLDGEGRPAGYGATSEVDENGVLTLRTHDRIILDAIDFKDRRVLDIGFGRGEAICYAYQNGAAECLGVDFSSAAVDLARQLIAQRGLPQAELHKMDALEFVDYYTGLQSADGAAKFDIVIMFDIVEHIPRAELRRVFDGLAKITHPNAVFVINTPAYRFDNDVVKDGLDERNQIDCWDTTDIRPETKGMHCNKYSLISLQQYMLECGFVNLTEAHYFIKHSASIGNIWGLDNLSYFQRWRLAQEQHLPLKADYKDDLVEFPYKVDDPPSLVNLAQGSMAGLALLTTTSYLEQAFSNGNYDEEVFSTLDKAEIEDAVVFDVGSFVGVGSLLFAKHGARCTVVGFEPNPWNRNRLFVNLSHNPTLASRISVFPYALGATNAVISMRSSSDVDNGCGSASRIDTSHPKIGNDSLPEGFFNADVELRTLDWFVETHKIPPDLVKIDVEGAEHIVLAGAVNTLREYKPILYIELHSEYCALLCSQILERLGYDIHVIKEEPDNRVLVRCVFRPAGTESERSCKDCDRFLRQYELTLQLNRMYDRSIKMLADETGNARTILASLQTEHHELQDKLRTLQERLPLLEGQVEALQNELVSLRAEHQALQNELVSLRAEHQALQLSRPVRYSRTVKALLRKLGLRRG